MRFYVDFAENFIFQGEIYAIIGRFRPQFKYSAQVSVPTVATAWR